MENRLLAVVKLHSNVFYMVFFGPQGALKMLIKKIGKCTV